MFGEFSGLRIAGSTFAAGLFYAGLSLFVTGPLIGERLVAKINWAGQCARFIEAEARAAEPSVSSVPALGCNQIFGAFLGRDGQDFCAVHGDLIDKNPFAGMLNQAADAERRAQEQRFEWAASQSSSRCECAVTTALESERVDLAVHAGSGRLITPPSVRTLHSDLVTALNTPACLMRG
jgi:hypothetical protein